MRSEYSNWVERARTLPVAFAQVREDPLLDLAVTERLPRAAEAIMIGSGGCTAALLACKSELAKLCVVDPNPSQIALCKVKLHLLRHYNVDSRLGVLGYTELSPEIRARQIEELTSKLEQPTNVFGPLELVSRTGLDYCGRYEAVFSELQSELAPCMESVFELLKMSNPAAQEDFFEHELRAHLNSALQEVMSQSNLVELFGEAATNNRIMPFADHFLARVHESLCNLPNASNPYMWQFLVGKYPTTGIPWLSLPQAAWSSQVEFSVSTIMQALTGVECEFDFVHLSNVLDWLSEDEACKTLTLAWNSLRAGGFVLIRQLNSTLNIRELNTGFQWLEQESTRLHSVDRSFFYRAIHLGRKP